MLLADPSSVMKCILPFTNGLIETLVQPDSSRSNQRFAYYLSFSYFHECTIGMFSRFRRYRFNYYLNILWFLFKSVIFTYNCTDLCFMCCYSTIMFYCFPMLNVSKFKVCIMLMFNAFIRVLRQVFLVRL